MKTAKELELSLLLKESHIQQLKLKITKLEEELKRLKEEYIILQNASEEYEDELQQRINKVLEIIKDDDLCSIEKIHKIKEILKGEDNE